VRQTSYHDGERRSRPASARPAGPARATTEEVPEPPPLLKEPVKVVDSKTGHDLTRAVLLQIISEQEAEGHEPLLTNKVLEQIVRFYGDSMQGVLSRYLEQSVFTFLEQQDLYQRRMREVLNANPLKLMQRLADQNIAFLRSLIPGATPPPRESRAETGAAPEPPAADDQTPLHDDTIDNGRPPPVV
jgi:polyhydroxyalkanoate synthesis repressor PhaR